VLCLSLQPIRGRTNGESADRNSDIGIVAAHRDSFNIRDIEDVEIIEVKPTISCQLGQDFECDGEVLNVFRADFEPEVPDPILSGIDI
jgi:hypothetical protein